MNYYENEDFSRSVWFISENDEIESCPLIDLCLEYAKEVNTPLGIRNEFFTEENRLMYWSGGKTKEAFAFDLNSEAEHALLLCHLHDLQNGDNNPPIFNTEHEAKQCFMEWA
jgi:hypothetical protein